MRDYATGLIFSVVVYDGEKCSVVGNMNQGDEWAEWASKSGLSQSELLGSLDHTLFAEPFVPFTESSLDSVKQILSSEAYDRLFVMLSKKSGIPNEESRNEEDLEEPEQEDVSSISVIDVGMSLFDAQFKELAVDYKANYHLTRVQFSSLALSVKATKSVWVAKENGMAWKSLTKQKYADDPAEMIYGKIYGRGLSRRLAMSSDFAPKKMKLVTKAEQNLDPRTARDADKDRIVLEGVATVNMGRGVPDPTPFGNARLARRVFETASVAPKRSDRRLRKPDATQQPPKTETPVALSVGAGPRRSSRRISSAVAPDRMGRGKVSFEPEEISSVVNRGVRGSSPKISRIAKRVGKNPPAQNLIEPKTSTRKLVGKEPRLDKRSMADRSVGWVNKYSERIASGKPPSVDDTPIVVESTKRKKIRDTDGNSGRMRRVVISQTTPMRSLFGLSSTRDEDSSNKKNLSEYTPTERSLLLGEARKVRADLLSQWRSRLGLADGSDVSEDEVLSYMDKLQNEGKNVYPLQIQAHNMMVLDELLHDADSNPDKNRDMIWWNIKENARAKIISDSGILAPTAKKEGDGDLTKPPTRPVKAPITAPPPKKPEDVVKAPQTPTGDPWAMDKNTRATTIGYLQQWLKNDGSYATFSDRFGDEQLTWEEHSPAEQSQLQRELDNRREELIASINERTTPQFPNDKDYRIDGVLRPESLKAMTEDAWVSLAAGGARLYPDIMSLIAINDLLNSPAWDVKARNEAWRNIDNTNRSVLSQRAGIQRRDLRQTGRRQGVVGERTVITPKTRLTQSGAAAETENTKPIVPDSQPEQPEEKPKESVSATKTPTARPVINIATAPRSAIVKSVRVMDENGNETVKEISEFGEENQYDYDDQYVDKDGNLFLMERGSNLYRNPVTGFYLENYSEKGIEVPVSIDTSLKHGPDLLPVQRSRSSGKGIVSYPQVTVDTKDKATKYLQLSDLRADNKTPSRVQKLTKLQAMAMAMEISETELLSRLGLVQGGPGKKFFFAVGVANDLSIDTARQAYNMMLMLDDADLTQEMKNQEIMTLDLIDATDMVDENGVVTAAQAYAKYADYDISSAPKDVPLGFHMSGATKNVTGYGNDYNLPDGSTFRIVRSSEIVYPPHVNREVVARNSNGSMSVFDLSELQGANRHYYLPSSIIPGVGNLGDVPLKTPKLIAVRYHPGALGNNHRNNERDPVVNVAKAVNRALVSDSPEDWFNAYRLVVNLYNTESQRAQVALSAWRKEMGERSRVKGPKRSFIIASERAEVLGKILTDVISPKMDKIVGRIRTTKEQGAKVYNQFNRARSKMTSVDQKNIPALEERLLGPVEDAEGKILERPPNLVVDLLKQNMTTGFLPQIPMNVRADDEYVLSELTEDQISMIAAIRIAEDLMLDPRNPDPSLLGLIKELDEELQRRSVYGMDTLNNARKKIGHKVALDNAGFTYKPVRLNVSEMKNLLIGYHTEAPESRNTFFEGIPTRAIHLLPIVRGIRSDVDFSNLSEGHKKLAKFFYGEEKTTSEAAQELVSGEYFVPGGIGGEAGGAGLNFYHATGGAESSYSGGGNDKSLLAVSAEARIVNKSTMELLSSNIDVVLELLNSAIYSDSGVERELRIDEETWNEDNFDFSVAPNVYSAYYSPYFGAAFLDFENESFIPGGRNNTNLFASAVAATVLEPSSGQYANETTAAISQNIARTRYERFSFLWKTLFDEDPPEKFSFLDSSDAEKINALAEEIIQKLETRLPLVAKAKRESEPRSRFDRFGNQIQSYDPRLLDLSHMASVAQEMDYHLSAEELKQISLDEWMKRTRAQVLSWFAQMEIAKGAAIAKARAAGETPWNEEIRKYVAAQEVLGKLNDQVMFGTVLGIDGYFSAESNYGALAQFVDPSEVQDRQFNDGSSRMFVSDPRYIFAVINENNVGGQFILLNRTAAVALDTPMTPSQIGEFVSGLTITDKNGKIVAPYGISLRNQPGSWRSPQANADIEPLKSAEERGKR